MRKRDGVTIEEFQRAMDEFFDEMLISPWRGAAREREPEEFERARVIDRRSRYEVEIEIPGCDPGAVEVEVLGQNLHVRIPCHGEGRLESSYSFAEKIDQERVTARWANDTLLVTLPKQSPKQVKVEQG